jgi:hypothetical protein
MNLKTAIYGGENYKAPISRGVCFRRVKSPDEDAKFCGNLWRNFMKLATKMAFGAEIGCKTDFGDRNS